jgi:Fe2+ transport system protein FeoA
MHVMERDFGRSSPRACRDAKRHPGYRCNDAQAHASRQLITGKAQSIQLTETDAAPHSVISRHMLAEWLLVKLLGAISNPRRGARHRTRHLLQLEARLDVLDPKVCPHGNPFPGCEEYTSQWKPLTELDAGQAVIIRRIHEFAEDNHDLLMFLSENGIAPGASAVIDEILPFNQTLTVRLEEKSLILGFPAARFVFAELKNL